jgi:hypothetical protein
LCASRCLDVWPSAGHLGATTARFVIVALLLAVLGVGVLLWRYTRMPQQEVRHRDAFVHFGPSGASTANLLVPPRFARNSAPRIWNVLETFTARNAIRSPSTDFIRSRTMKSLKRKLMLAAAVIATAGVFGANASDEQQAVSSSQPVSNDSLLVANAASPRASNPESPQFERFENQLSMMSAPSYTPSEHPDAKPAPRSAHSAPSVWDNPMNTASLGG